jgi:hypothetical protein
MDTDSSVTEAISNQETVLNRTSRPPPVIPTFSPNQIQLQKQLKCVVKRNFDFRSTRNGTRVFSRGMADFQSVKSHFDANSLFYYLFHLKPEKPMKAVIRHLPQNTPADGLVSLGFDISSVKQMTVNRRSPSKWINNHKPLSLPNNLTRAAKSQERFRLQSLCYIAITVKAYRALNDLTQCHNCQQFYHIWANCKQPPRCLWCGGSHLHKECPERGNTSSTTTFCKYRLAEGENPIPKIIGAAGTRRRRCRKRSHRGHPGPQQERCPLPM